MKRVLTVLIMLVSSFVPVAVFTASSASATCAPPSGVDVIYSFRNVAKAYAGTNIMSDWVHPQYGPATITYSKSTTAELNASVTATVGAEGSVIFAKASASIGVTVGGSWSKDQTWSYSLTYPKDPYHLYRLHLYHYSVNFQVMKKYFSPGSCNYVNAWGSWQQVTHAPVTGNTNSWKTDKIAA